MRGRSTSLPPLHHPAVPVSPTPPGIRSISFGGLLRDRLEIVEEDASGGEPLLHFHSAGRSDFDNSSSMGVRGTLEDIGAQVIITLRGASYKLLRFHLHDWLALVLLAVMDIILNIISPFYRYVGQPMIKDYIYPLKPNSVPLLAVPAIAVLIPLVIFIIYFLYTKDITDLHHAILGLFYSVLITAVITDTIKNYVGRARPDFFWRCFPDGVEMYNNVSFEVICHGDAAVIKEGHKSFPSGHTSWCFSGLGFLSLYLAGKLQPFNKRGHVVKLVIVTIPLLGALLVGLSRIRDYWHHWSDVFVGAVLGLIVSSLCYHHLFPSVFNDLSAGPYNYLQIRNNFTSSWLSWVPRRQQHTDWPSERNRSQDLDMELGRNSDVH